MGDTPDPGSGDRPTRSLPGEAGEPSSPTETPTLPSAGAAGTDPPESTIGPYRLARRLGAGGMGEVWLAEQQEPVRRQVAVKIIKRGMDTDQVIARFEAERQALAMMSHPAIAKVLDAGATAAGRPYFVMEYVGGEPITAYCDRHRLDIARRLALFIQVCEGVQHAHQKGIIHRDLKPSNVLVELQDGEPAPKTIDIGVAKAVEQRLTERTLFTELGVMVGTPEYMSPEQAEASDDIDTRTDVYSLGILLYELLVGDLPLDPTDLRRAGYEEIRRRIREEEPPRPSTRVFTLGEAGLARARCRRTDPGSLGRRLRGDLDWVVMMALEKERSRRYATPSEIAADLRRHLSDEPVAAGPPSAAYRAAKFARRHRFGVSVAAVAVLALVGVAVGMSIQARRIAQSRSEAEQVSDFLIGLFRVSEPSESRGNQVTARELLDRSVGRIERELGDNPEVQGRMLHVMGEAYLGLGLFDTAEGLLGVAVETRERALGGDDPATLASRATLGSVYQAQGRFEDAEALQEEVLALREASLGERHRDTIDSRLRLASAHLERDRNEEAEPLLKEALATLERSAGEDDPLTLSAVGILGVLYKEEGRFDEAEPLLRRALEGRRRLQGDDHPETLKAMNNLASFMARQGRYPEAEALLREALEIQTRVLGGEHREVLDSMGNLASLLWQAGRIDAARETWGRTLEIRRRVLGPEHPDTLITMNNIAVTYAAQGNLRQAEAAWIELLEVQRRVLGEDNRTTLTTLGNIGLARNQLGRFDEARATLEEVLAIQRKTLPPNHPDTLRTMTSLASSYRQLGRLDQAETLYEEVLAERRRRLGDDNRETLIVMDGLANLYRSQGRLEEAEALLLKTLGGIRRTLGEDHPNVVYTLDNLADLYRSGGRTDEERAITEQTLAFHARAAGAEGASAAARNGYARRLLTCEPEDLRDPTTALREAEAAVGADDPPDPAFLDTLALAQERLGRTADAVATLERALALLPADDPSRAALTERLARLGGGPRAGP